MTRGVAEKVVVISRSKRSGRIMAAVTANGITKTRHGVACQFDGKPAVRVMEPVIGEVALVISPSK